MLLAGTQLAAADPGDCTVIELAAYQLDSDSDGKTAAMAANSADCSACLNEETACTSTNYEASALSDACCPDWVGETCPGTPGCAGCACTPTFTNAPDGACTDGNAIHSPDLTDEYALNPDYYKFRCWKPINACTEMDEYGSCETLGGVTMDDTIWVEAGGECLGATTEGRCGNLLYGAVTYCIWDAAQVDGAGFLRRGGRNEEGLTNVDRAAMIAVSRDREKDAVRCFQASLCPLHSLCSRFWSSLWLFWHAFG
jgi:hypothetical protein